MAEIGEVLSFSDSPPGCWGAICDERGSVFQSADWHEVLRSGLGAHTQYVSRSDGQPLTSVTTFRAGPFRIGYVGFPAGRTFDGCCTTASVLLANVEQLRRGLRVDSLRIPVGGFANCPRGLDLRYHGLQETGIVNLQAWRETDVAGSARRNVRKALREGVRVEDAGAEDSRAIWQIYKETIATHRGLLRYGECYFQELMTLALRTTRLRVRVARKSGVVLAYFIMTLEGEEAIYLHGGLARDHSALRPSDLLYLDAISWAQEQGVKTLSFLSSPKDQPDLMRYKEKWGGQSAEERIYLLDLRPVRARAFELSLLAYRKLGRLFS